MTIKQLRPAPSVGLAFTGEAVHAPPPGFAGLHRTEPPFENMPSGDLTVTELAGENLIESIESKVIKK